MTFILIITGPQTIWALADRRLSRPSLLPFDNACKLMSLNTTDGEAILGYAGLGRTALGTEPSKWMSAVLRGQNLSMEDSLRVLANAVWSQIPKHLASVPAEMRTHVILASCFVGNDLRTRAIDLIESADQKQPVVRVHTLFNQHPNGNPLPARIVIAGSGMRFLPPNGWARPLLRLVRAYDEGKIFPHVVADALAELNLRVSKKAIDGSVGPSCIVAWRYKVVGLHKGTCGHQSYTGCTRDLQSPTLPLIVQGMDMQAIGQIYMQHYADIYESNPNFSVPFDPDTAGLNEKISKLPFGPDEKLR